VGKELLAYIPSPAVRKLSLLTTAPYNHTYYADGTPTITDACPSTTGCTSSSSWKSVLVSGMNAGGQSIFALDVTNPANFAMPASGAASSLVLWEFTDNADADLGYTFGIPLIAQMNNGQWAAIFGNGYNNTAVDGQASTTGYGYLYIAFLHGPTGTTPSNSWTLGTDYIKLKAGNSTTTPGTTAAPNGLGGPVGVDVDLNGTIDILYAGDLYGNIWKFDVSESSAGSWNTAFSGQPLFTAKDSSGNAQPITGGLSVSFSSFGGFFLTFGTGSFVFSTDGATTNTQTLYGILDRNDGTTRIPSTYRNLNSTDSLQQQELVFSGTGVTVNGQQVAVLSNCLVNYPGQNLASTANPTLSASTCPTGITETGSPTAPVQLGWYFDLPNSGERFVANQPLVQSGTVDFVTLIPQPGITCTGGASGFEYILNLNTGGQTSNTVFDLTGSGLQNSAQQYTSGSGTSYVVNARALPTGSIINTPGRFILPASNTTTGAAGTAGGAGGSAAGCAGGTFVAGFGCTGVPVNGSLRAANGYGSANSTGLFLPGQKGRLYWRQLFTQ
jgi:type IV pilus assembly protein PilY1